VIASTNSRCAIVVWFENLFGNSFVCVGMILLILVVYSGAPDLNSIKHTKNEYFIVNTGGELHKFLRIVIRDWLSIGESGGALEQ